MRSRASPRCRAVAARSAAAVTALALLALAAAASAAAPPPPPPPPALLDAAPAPGAVMAVPPPAPPPLLAPSEAAERFARSLVLESVGEADDGGQAASAGAPAAAAVGGGGDGELLRWAIAHSDPAALRAAAQRASASSSSSSSSSSPSDLTLEERRARVAELRAVMEGGGIASDADLIREAVGLLEAFLLGRGPGGAAAAAAGAAAGDGAAPAKTTTTTTTTTAGALSALERLADLAQSIDHANDLRPLGALAPLAALIAPGNEARSTAAGAAALRAAAARCVGVAASNNARFQGDLLAAHPRAVAHLLDALATPPPPEEEGGDAEEERLRLPLLFAASTFARSAAPASREAFFAAGGLPRLVALLGEESARRYPALALNAAVLLGDLADLGASGDDAGALAAAVARADDGGGVGSNTWGALAEGALGAVGRADSAAATDKALSAVRALAGLVPGRAALAAAGGEGRLAEAGEAAAAAGAAGAAGGSPAFSQYLSELAAELSGLLREGAQKVEL